MSTKVPVGVTDSQLAVLLRQVQWALDDAAHEFPAGRATAGRRVELAGTLEALAVVLRTSVSESAGHPDGDPGDGLPIPATVAVYRVPPSLDVCQLCVPLPGDVEPSPPGPVDAPPPQFPTTPQVF